MSSPVLTFFNNKGGVGKTSLAYHLAWMFSNQGKTVVVMDCDPQANLTAALMDEDTLETIWEGQSATSAATIYRCIRPMLKAGDLLSPSLHKVKESLYLIPGDLELSAVEDTLSEQWVKSLEGKEPYRPFRLLTAFWQIAQMGANQVKADLIIVDVGPNLGAINRSALIATDGVVMPLGADLFSLQGLKNLGPTMKAWRSDWQRRLNGWPEPEFELPAGRMKPMGYLVQQHSIRNSRPVLAYDRWIQQIPGVYRNSVLDEANDKAANPSKDPYCLAMLKHYRSLVPMAQEHRKPVFELTPADGAIGSHFQSVQQAKKDFQLLAGKIGKQLSF